MTAPHSLTPVFFSGSISNTLCPQAVKRAKADSAPVDPGRVCNLAAAVICGLCDTAATGRWQQQHLDAAQLLISCVPASSFASVSPYCCKLVTLLAPQHAAAGSTLACAAVALALCSADECVGQLMQATRSCVAAASEGKLCRLPSFFMILTFGNVQEETFWLPCIRGSRCTPRTPALLRHLLLQLQVGAAV